ncbi:MAG TPA: tetratricopeptide repeat protein [Acidobacteriota bacterium]|nr:tetratricopeptide repeat protein [Acidobacteriota bacterium]
MIILVAAAVIFPALYSAYGIFRADRIIRSGQTIENYSRAIEYTPSNAELWWHRGRLRHYGLHDVDLELAAADYSRALELNPRLSRAWVDLADCHERAGRIKEAETALRRAIAVHRYSPLAHWQAGNFYLRQERLDEMYASFKTASNYDIGKLGIAMHTAWKIDPDREGILRKLIPDTLAANLSYLAFLVARDELDLAAPVWQRCLENAIPADFTFRPSSVFGYINRLLAGNRIEEAYAVWNNALLKARSLRPLSSRYQAVSGTAGSGIENLAWNGSFENDILQGGFDWRFADISGVGFFVDSSRRMEGLKSLRVRFDGVNLSAPVLMQIIPVPSPGTYTLDFYARSENLTTDQTPYMAVHGYPEMSGASGRSESFPASADWRRYTVNFDVRPGSDAIRLSLHRDASKKFDNQLRGALWLDVVTIRRSNAY